MPKKAAATPTAAATAAAAAMPPMELKEAQQFLHYLRTSSFFEGPAFYQHFLIKILRFCDWARPKLDVYMANNDVDIHDAVEAELDIDSCLWDRMDKVATTQALHVLAERGQLLLPALHRVEMERRDFTVEEFVRRFNPPTPSDFSHVYGTQYLPEMSTDFPAS